MAEPRASKSSATPAHTAATRRARAEQRPQTRPPGYGSRAPTTGVATQVQPTDREKKGETIEQHSPTPPPPFAVPSPHVGSHVQPGRTRPGCRNRAQPRAQPHTLPGRLPHRTAPVTAAGTRTPLPPLHLDPPGVRNRAPPSPPHPDPLSLQNGRSGGAGCRFSEGMSGSGHLSRR
jgi:hypothetical protein